MLLPVILMHRLRTICKNCPCRALSAHLKQMLSVSAICAFNRNHHGEIEKIQEKLDPNRPRQSSLKLWPSWPLSYETYEFNMPHLVM